MNRRGFLAFLITAPVTKALPWSGIAKVIEPFAPATSAAIGWTLKEIVETAIREHSSEIAKQINDNNALLRRLREK